MAISCDISRGRLESDCLDNIAGVRTVFFMKHSDLVFTKNLAGVIDTLGPATIFRFEQDETHGLALQEINRSGETQYIKFQIDFTVFYVDPGFLQTINYLKQGLWAIFFLDMEGKIRLLGESTAMNQVQGINQSGTGPGDTKWCNLSFEGFGDNYAPFLEDFTEYPFDNFPPIDVIPRYDNLPGLILQNDALDYILVDDSGNKLDYN